MTKKIYAISKYSYGNTNITTYDSYQEWTEAINNETFCMSPNDHINAEIYEIDNCDDLPVERNRSWSGKEYKGRRVYVDTARVGYEDDNGEFHDLEPTESHEVYGWSIDEVWAERDSDGNLTLLSTNIDDKPEPKNGGEVVIAYASGDSMISEIYETEEEAREYESPAQYLYS